MSTRSLLKLGANTAERRHYDSLANLYSIIVACDGLERAFSNGVVPTDEYKRLCSELISQFRTAKRVCNMVQSSEIEGFMRDYDLLTSCSSAYHRLVEVGIPDVGHITNGHAKLVAETVQYFITLMDSLKLNMVAVDEIQPLLADLHGALAKVAKPDFEGLIRTKQWLTTLNSMQATDELNESQIRQMLLDLENAHSGFYNSLQ